MKPLIGVPGRRKPASAIEGFPDNLAALPVDLYAADFARGLLAAGAIPVHLPVDLPAAEAMDRLDGLLLPGGADVDPTLYGATSETDLFPPEPERDRSELELLDAALELDRPVLGVCRGLQLLNVHGGGTLNQHVPDHARFDIAPDREAHLVRFAPGSRLERVYGPERTVNSLHHQTIDRLADGFVVTGTSEDGCIEGIERDDRVMAVQWHPELMVGRDRDPIFGWLVEQAATTSS